MLAPAHSPDEEDLQRAIDVREAFRALLLANNGAPLDRGAAAHLDRAGRESRLRVGFTNEGVAYLEPVAEGWSAVLTRLLEIVIVARLQGNWSRLKACRNQECHWIFYDTSKNRSGKWCTMRLCGNQMNARAYRRRTRRRGSGMSAPENPFSR